MLARLIDSYKLRWKRRRYLLRALRKRNQLALASDKTTNIIPSSVLCFVCVRNERTRLPYFFEHYRRLGVQHFLVVDNGSTDGSSELLHSAPDVSVWRTNHSYRLSRFGMDWLTWLMIVYGHDRWCLTVDADELLVYDQSTTQDLRALSKVLDAAGETSFGALMLDMYPKGPLGLQTYKAGDDPIDVLGWFDPDGYDFKTQKRMNNLWVQGGPRARQFFAQEFRRAPTLNKIPFVKWSRRFVYVNSTHSLLPKRLNDVQDYQGSEKPSGVLLHTKFLPEVVDKSSEEKQRDEHFNNSALYDEYYDALSANPDLWHKGAARYEGPQQLIDLGLMYPIKWGA